MRWRCVCVYPTGPHPWLTRLTHPPLDGDVKTLLRWITGHCDIHDRPHAHKIAELETATGINPRAVEELWARGPLAESFYDPDIVDCGRRRCRQRRGLPS